VRSPIYWHPFLYACCIRLLYGRHFDARYKAVADRVPGNASVFECCAGDAMLYTRYLSSKQVRYAGGDANDTFVRAGRKRGVELIRHDILRDAVPQADCVILQGSLYQFIPGEKAVVDKLLAAAKERLIIAEPIINLASHHNPIIAFLGQVGANPGSGKAEHRFTEQTLDRFMLANFRGQIREAVTIAGGREKMYVLSPRGCDPKGIQ